MSVLKNYKRIFALLLALVLVICVVPVQNAAATETKNLSAVTEVDGLGTLSILANGEPIPLEKVDAIEALSIPQRSVEFDESEPNNSLATADRIYNDYEVLGSLSNSDPWDYYKFVLSSKSNLEIVGVCVYNTLRIGIANSGGSWTDYTYINWLGQTSNGYYGFFVSDEYDNDPTLNAGTYYIAVTDAHSTNKSNTYVFGFTYEASAPSHTHSYGSWTVVTPATCVSVGSESRSCSCGQKETREIPIDSNAHNLVDVPAEAASCTAAGLSAGKKCTLCGVFTVPQQTVPATGHNYNDGVVVAPGTMQYTCNTCGHSYQEPYEEPTSEFVAAIGSTQYRTVWDALLAAKAGDTVELIANSDERGKTLFITSGVTLDLNTYDLKADGLIALKDAYLNAGRYGSGDYGRLYIPKANLIISGGEAVANGNYDVIPVWNGSDAYVLANALINDTASGYGLTVDRSNMSIKFSFGQEIGKSAKNAFFLDGASDNAVKVIIRLEWSNENGDAFQDFVYNDGFVAKVSGGGYNYSFALNNYDLLNISLSTLKVTAMIITDAGTITTGQVWYGYAY